jgi:hypothetical protein
MKDRIFENALNVIRNYLKEEGVSVTPPVNNTGNVMDIEKKGPPVYLNKKPPLVRRPNSGKHKYPS